MSRQSKFVISIVVVSLLVSSLLAGCTGRGAPTAAPTAAPTTVATEPPPPTPEPPTPTPEPAPGEPRVGGKIVWARFEETFTLDAHKANFITVLDQLGATLVTIDPKGRFINYLCEKWQVSPDGKTWDFTLRKGIKFHDGTPLTAQDYAWTFQRMLDPAVATGGARSLLGPVVSAEALDDTHLRLKLQGPYAPFLFSLAVAGFMQPLSTAAVEQAGESYARNPVGVGPYRLKEWQTGNKIVLERNPDYEWGPAYMHRGPYYIQEIEYRNIPEESTVLAGLEAGEIDIATIKAKDVSRLKASGRLQIFEGMRMGVPVGLVMNLEKPPFDDLRVRKALNLAVDRETLANVVLQGTAVPEYGPMARPMIGYWSGVEEIGYGYDVAQAKALLADAGYTAGASGFVEKDGKPFKFVLLVTTADPTFVKVSEVLKESYKAIGVDLEIRVQEDKLVIADMVEGNYEVSVLDFNYPEADCLFMLFHSSMIGAINMGHTKDAELDELLLSTRTTMDPVKRQEALIAVQRRVIEQAYLVPIYTPKTYLAVSNKVKGAVFSPLTAGMYYIHLGDAYIEE